MARQNHAALFGTLLIAIALAFFGHSCTRSEDTAVADRKPSTAPSKTVALCDGLYPLVWEAATPESANLVAPQQVVLPYDRKYSGSTEKEPRTYLAIGTSSMVPLILEGQPDATRDGTGRALLSVTLAPEYVKALEDFTGEHLGEGVAIVLDGEVVTMHKVRSVIREGKLQITRCDENSCEVLRSRLAKQSDTER